VRAPIAAVVLALLAAGCPHQAPQPDAAVPGFDVGPPAPEFSSTPVIDDAVTMAMDPASVPHGGSACRATLLARVTRIVDGDTIHVDGVSEPTGDLTIRFIGVNAPEIAHGPGTVADCYGDEATTFTSQLDGHLVWLSFDADCLDVYGRTLAYVTYGPAEHQMWERQMLRRGFARVLSVAPNTTYRTVFEGDETIAQAERVGLWSACP
jgi:micrococcal nuclease